MSELSPTTPPWRPVRDLRFATAGSVDDGKSTLIGRLLYDTKTSSPTSSRPSSAPRPTAATTTPTSRCSPTACGPSASRASPSTSRTATSRRRRARSSSPTPPATCSTPATWSPAPRPPTSRWCSSTRARASSSRPAGTRRCRALLRRAAPGARGQQDGPRRLGPGRLRPHRRRLRGLRRRAARSALPDVTAVPLSALHGDNVVDRSRRDPLVRRPDAARAPRAGPRRPRRGARPQRPLPGAVRHPPDVDRAPRLPRLRRHARRRAAAPRRRGRRAAERPHAPRSPASTPSTASSTRPSPGRPSPCGWPTRSTSAAATCSPPPTTRPRRVELRGHGLLDGRRPARAPAGGCCVKHTTRTVKAVVDRRPRPARRRRRWPTSAVPSLGLNDIGRVTLRTASPLVVDPYAVDRRTGAFILVDEATGATVGAGMVAARRTARGGGQTLVQLRGSPDSA